MDFPEELKYSKEHLWVRVEGDRALIGITDYAQNQLSDIVFVEILVDEGDTIEAGKAIASVESVKASAEIYAPARGTVSAVNKDLSNKPETLNSDPYGEGWMVKVEGGSPGETMDSAAYEKYCQERSH